MLFNVTNDKMIYVVIMIYC